MPHPKMHTAVCHGFASRSMELSSRKPKRTIEPVDEWLQNEGYYRKHAPKDPTCLFRAVSEQVYKNQRHHIKVRKDCVEFMRKNKDMFQEKIAIPLDSYLEQMACFTEWGGMNEILAMSLLFKRNVVIFHGHKLTKESVIDHGYKSSLFLCFTPPKQYETVYTQEYTANAGFCQALVYQTLYKNVFNMGNVDVTVNKMLHERSNHLRHDKFFLKGNIDMRNQLTVELLEKIEDNADSEETQLISRGITPFPYRVAKALDPNIYRNVDYDVWQEIRRDVRNSGYTKFNSPDLQVGAKCLVRLTDLRENDKANNNFLSSRENWDNNGKIVTKPKRLEPLFYTGHIQEMSKNEGPVVVFVEELGEKKTVPYEYLKPFPQRKMKQNWPVIANKRNIITQNPKWKKPWHPTNRKGKDPVSVPHENGFDKNLVNNSAPNTKNVAAKTEWNGETISENNNVKVQTENNIALRNCSANVDNDKTAVENTHVSLEDTVHQAAVDRKNKNSSSNNESLDSTKKNAVTNYNDVNNQLNKQNIQRTEKTNEVFYPPYASSPYPPTVQELVSYDPVKNVDVESNDIQYSDPASSRHFINVGAKYYWSQNMWSNGTNGPVFNDSYYVAQSPSEMNVNVNTNMMNCPVPNGENMGQDNKPNNNIRHNNRTSPPRHKNQENPNGNGSRYQGGQKTNYRGPEYRNVVPRDSHLNVDMNKNRVDCKNANISDQQMSNSNDMQQRGNKSNSMAPRFKKNYEGRNRNDHHNGQHRNLQQHQQQHPLPQLQHHQDYDYRNNKKVVDNQVMVNQCDVNEMHQMHHPQHHQQQPSMLPPQMPPPPPMNGAYSYPMPYNQQVPYVSMSPYPPEAEGFPGHYYQPAPSFIQVPYLPQAEMGEPSNMGGAPCGVTSMYAPMDNYPAQYPMYSQYVYHPASAIYANQSGPSNGPMPPEGCYPTYPGQAYFIPYPQPPLPPNMGPGNSPTPPLATMPSMPPNPQSTPTH